MNISEIEELMKRKTKETTTFGYTHAYCMKPEDIAEEINRSRATIYNWASLWNKNGWKSLKYKNNW